MQQFIIKNKGDPKALQSDGSVLITEIPGEMYIAMQHAEAFAKQMKGYGIRASVDAFLQEKESTAAHPRM